MHYKSTLLAILCLSLCIAGCKKWDDHTAIANQDVSKTLLQEISQRSNLSKFNEYLQKTGLDKELSSSRTFTVWAPTNDALQSLDAATVNDTARLRKFLQNHISIQSYFTRNAPADGRVLMLNGKRVSFSSGKFDEANIVEADKYVGNGVLHVIDKVAPLLPNAWELVNDTRTNYLQHQFILSLNYLGFDPALAIVDSISAVTGRPVYRPGTGIVSLNAYNQAVQDLRSEEKQYTYFILDNAAFNAETNELKPYFVTGTADSTTNLAAYAVAKDLIVEGVYTQAQLPDTLVSKFGVKIPINKSKIVETRRMSNGIAYVMSEVNFTPKNKIPEVVVQGENYRAFYRADGTQVSPQQNGTSAIFRRIRVNPENGQTFNDIYVYGHGISGLNAWYQVNNLPSAKYKVYWVAVNDTVLAASTRVRPPTGNPFQQRLAMGSRTSTTLGYVTLAPFNYSEVYIGDYTQAAYGTLDMFLTAFTNTNNDQNRLTLDYIKLVPDIP